MVSTANSPWTMNAKVIEGGHHPDMPGRNTTIETLAKPYPPDLVGLQLLLIAVYIIMSTSYYIIITLLDYHCMSYYIDSQCVVALTILAIYALHKVVSSFPFEIGAILQLPLPTFQSFCYKNICIKIHQNETECTQRNIEKHGTWIKVTLYPYVSLMFIYIYVYI